MGLTRIISALAMGICGWTIISTPLYAASTINYRIEQDSCPIIADRRFSASPSYLCHLRTTNSGSVISWLVAKNRHITLFASLATAGPNQLFPHSDGTKDSTVYHLGHFGYVKENWIDISSPEVRKVETESGLRLTLHKIDLEKEKGCIGFSSGVGDAGQTVSSGTAHKVVLSALACPRIKVDTDELMQALTQIKITLPEQAQIY